MPHERAHLLLVDDDPDDLFLTLAAFESKGLDVEIGVARDGEEALDYLACQGRFAQRDPGRLPQLVLLDIKLPRLSGLEVLERIRSNPATVALPVVLFTSSDEDRDISDGFRLGANSYIRKPVDFVELERVVEYLGDVWLKTDRDLHGNPHG